MTKRNRTSMPRDRQLGMDSRISRRDFLNSVMIGSGVSLLSAAAPSGSSGAVSAADAPARTYPPVNVGPEWYGYGGVGDYAPSHGNTADLVNMAHKIRDGRFDTEKLPAEDTGETFDLVIIGDGIAGLAGAYTF